MAANSQHLDQNTEAGILARLIQTRQDNLSRDAAAFLLSLHFDQRDISRMNELSEQARLGTLVGADAAELDSYIHVSNLLAIMQSKARHALRSPRGIPADKKASIFASMRTAWARMPQTGDSTKTIEEDRDR